MSSLALIVRRAVVGPQAAEALSRRLREALGALPPGSVVLLDASRLRAGPP